MSARILSFFRPALAASGDWSQQELAEFYRVEAASLQAGLKLSLERGVSDEGDPWLVFCREDGEVFLHFTRIDGSYVIVSDMMGEPLVGPDFRTLLAELVARNPSVLPINRQVLAGSGGRGGAQILMHPAALLAAIVATTCLLSSMNEAVASELEGAPLSGERPSGDTVSHLDIDATLRHQNYDAVNGEAARSRASEQRELAVSISVVMACIASFLHQSSNQTDPSLLTKLMSTEPLSSQTLASAETERMATADAASQDHGAGRIQWLEAQDARGESTIQPEHRTWLHPTPSEAAAILLATPGASVVTIGLAGPLVLAKGSAFEGASLHVVQLTSSGTVRLVAPHAADTSSTTAKSSANAATAETGSVAGSSSNTSAENSAPETATKEAIYQPEQSRPTIAADKILVSSSVTTASHSVGGSKSTASSLSPAGSADLSIKVSLSSADDNASSHMVAQVNDLASAVSVSHTVAASTLMPSHSANGKSGTSAFQDLGILSAKTVSLFLHSLIGDLSKSGVADGAKGPSSQPDIVSFTSQASTSAIVPGSSKVTSGLTVTDAASANTTTLTTVIDLATGSPLTIGTKPAPDHAASDMSTPGKSLLADVTVTAGLVKSGYLATAIGSTGETSTATASVDATTTKISEPKLPVTVVDATPAAVRSDTLPSAKQDSTTAVQGATLPTTGTPETNGTTNGASTSIALTIPTSTTPQDVASAKPAGQPIATEAEHTGALHSVTALVSATNTVTKAVSISVTAGPVSLDAVQLRIIDTFIASTPNIEFRATDNTLEIYGRSAYDDPSLNVMTWDLGGGTFVKVIGIGDLGHFV